MTRRRNSRTGKPVIQDADQAALLGKRWHDIRDSLAALSRESASGRAKSDIDGRIDALVDESIALERRLARTPADSLAGVKAKLRIARVLLRDFSGRDSIEGRLLASAFRDLGRLKAGTA